MKEPFDIFFRQTFEFINNIGGMYVVYKKMLEYFKTKKNMCVIQLSLNILTYFLK